MVQDAVISWLNVASLIISTIAFVWLYVLSVGPAVLEKKIGDKAYHRCTVYRYVSGLFIVVILVNYGMYLVYPLEIALPKWFPWPWWYSVGVACLLSIPFNYIWFRGVRDAGKETMRPDKSHEMYGGIYQYIRHPQAVGEHGVWVLIGFATHSPFIALYSLIWIPAAVIMSIAEERDLVIRYGEPYERYRLTTGAFIPKEWFGESR